MFKRAVVVGIVLAVLVALGPLSVYAQGTTPTDTTKSMAKSAETSKVTGQVKTPAAGTSNAANTIAVCACGMAFVPDANTKYVEYGGKKYACCSDACDKMATADPAKAAKMADENMAKVMAQLKPAPKTETPGEKK